MARPALIVHLLKGSTEMVKKKPLKKEVRICLVKVEKRQNAQAKETHRGKRGKEYWLSCNRGSGGVGGKGKRRAAKKKRERGTGKGNLPFPRYPYTRGGKLAFCAVALFALVRT